MMVQLKSLKPLIYFLLGAAMVIMCMLFYLPAQRYRTIEGVEAWRNGMKVAYNKKQTEEHQDLVRVLQNAAMNNNTVILTTLNEAWSVPNSMFDLFLESFHIGEQTEQLLKHVVIIAMDPKAFDRCKSKHSHCYYLITEGVNFSAEKIYMSPDYLKMMWKRLEFLGTVLELGYNFVFTDMDIMWFRSPFPHLSGNAHYMTASDTFNGNSSDLQNWPNNGFVYAKSCEQTIDFYKYWYLSRKLYPGDHEQNVLKNIIADSNFPNFGLQMRFLDTTYFGGFCELRKDLNKLCTMHANCCISMKRKIYDLRIVLDDWKNYTAQPAETKKWGGYTWRAPDKCKMFLGNQS